MSHKCVCVCVCVCVWNGDNSMLSWLLASTQGGINDVKGWLAGWSYFHPASHHTVHNCCLGNMISDGKEFPLQQYTKQVCIGTYIHKSCENQWEHSVCIIIIKHLVCIIITSTNTLFGITVVYHTTHSILREKLKQKTGNSLMIMCSFYSLIWI